MKIGKSFKVLRNLLLASCLALPGAFTSCNFLEVDDLFDDTMKFDSIFVKYDYLVQYMWGVSDLLPDGVMFFVLLSTLVPWLRMKLLPIIRIKMV